MRPRFINRIDWQKLNIQKHELIDVISSFKEDVVDFKKKDDVETAEAIQGSVDKLDDILHLIDAI